MIWMILALIEDITDAATCFTDGMDDFVLDSDEETADDTTCLVNDPNDDFGLDSSDDDEEEEEKDALGLRNDEDGDDDDKDAPTDGRMVVTFDFFSSFTMGASNSADNASSKSSSTIIHLACVIKKC